MALNTWAVSTLRHGAGILSGIRMNYKKWTERLVTMNKELHQKSVMLHDCKFLGKMVEEDLLDVKIT